MAYLMNGNKVSMPLANFANLPLDAKTVADSVSQALDTTILPMTARYVGLMIFCEAENNYYVFSKHDDGTGTGTLTSGILNSDFQPFNPSNAIASNTKLGQVIIKLNGGIEVDPDGTIYIKGMSTTSTTDPTTGNTTDVFTLGGITITTVTDGGGNVISQTTDIPGGITGTTTTDPTTGETTTTGSIGGVTSITTTDPSGNQYSKVGDKIVSGTKTDVTTTTTTDANGNPVTTTVTTTQTPNGTKRVTQTDSVDPTSVIQLQQSKQCQGVVMVLMWVEVTELLQLRKLILLVQSFLLTRVILLTITVKKRNGRLSKTWIIVILLFLEVLVGIFK